MRIPGERVKRTRLVQTDQYVVAVDVEMVIPPDDPDEPDIPEPDDPDEPDIPELEDPDDPLRPLWPL